MMVLKTSFSDTLEYYIPEGINLSELSQSDFPRIAKDERIINSICDSIKQVPTNHRIILGDSRRMKEEEVHLVVTSPPYWTLKRYDDIEGQLGIIEDYERFLEELDKVWIKCFNALIPGGRLVVVVGDVCLARRKYGRHRIMPLHASIQEHCRKIGFDLLTPIIWYKITNASLEASGGRFFGKPYESNCIIKNDIEYILFMRKPGGYRTPDTLMRVLSIIPEKEHHEFFQQIWTMNGAPTKNHPAPYPLELAERIVRMFSFVGDTVLDPFLGTGTTLLAAEKWGRNGVGYEIDPNYVKEAYKRLNENFGTRGSRIDLIGID